MIHIGVGHSRCTAAKSELGLRHHKMQSRFSAGHQLLGLITSNGTRRRIMIFPSQSYDVRSAFKDKCALRVRRPFGGPARTDSSLTFRLAMPIILFVRKNSKRAPAHSNNPQKLQNHDSSIFILSPRTFQRKQRTPRISGRSHHVLSPLRYESAAR